MDELLILLQQFISILEKQMLLHRELLPILDAEEDMIARFDMVAFEKIVIEKDQLSKRAQAVEEQRCRILKRICYMIAFDPREKKLSLKTFLIAFETYIKNIATLVEQNIYTSLLDYQRKLLSLSQEYMDLFQNIGPRIYRNQLVLKKILYNFSRSIVLMQNTVDLTTRYNSLGKSQQGGGLQETNSSLQIKA